MASRYRGTIYIGVTPHLAARILPHRTGAKFGEPSAPLT